MKAIVIHPFPGRPDNGDAVVNFKEGDVVEGDLARVAIENGWAKSPTEKRAAETPPKAQKKGVTAETDGQ